MQYLLTLHGGRAGRLDSARPQKLRLAACSRATASEAVERCHYIGRLGAVTVDQFAVFEDERFIGAIVFGAGPRCLPASFGLVPRATCELIRVALDRHPTPVSRILRVAILLLRAARPDLRMIVSYADDGAGHHGGIYQAGGWTYTGGVMQHMIRLHGVLVHPRTLGARYGCGGQAIPWLRAIVDPAAERVLSGVKHRYLLGFDEPTRARVAALALPYPMRAK